MTIKLENLRYFCEVASAGNLAEASDRVGRTQSALSISLKQLEAHLGASLFDGERKNQLSPIGEQIFTLAQHQIREFDQTVQTMEASAKATNGLIRIASVPSVAAIVFPAVLRQLNERYPGVKVELRDTDSWQVLDALTNGKADIGIASGFHTLNGVAATPLFEDQFGLICASNHALLKKKKPPSVDDVVTRHFIRNSLCDLILTPSFVDALSHVNVTVHNNHSLINIISKGRWVSVLPETVSLYLPDSVSFRPLSDLSDKRKVWLYYREHSRFGELIDVCRKLIGEVNMG